VENRLLCLSSRGCRQGVTDTAQAVSHTIFVERGLRGPLASNLEHRNSFLSHLLRQGVGIPMSLGLLWVAVARRVGLACGLVATVPSHVLVRVYGAGPDGEDGFVDALTGGALMNAVDMPAYGLTRYMRMQKCTPADVFGRMLGTVARVFETTLRRHPQQLETSWRLFGIYEQLLTLKPGSAAVPIKLKRVNLALGYQGDFRYPGDVLRREAAIEDTNDMQESWEEAEEARADQQSYESSEVDDDDETEESPLSLERNTERHMLRERSCRWYSPSSMVACFAVAAVVLLGGLVPKLPIAAGAPSELSLWPNRLATSDTCPQTYG